MDYEKQLTQLFKAKLGSFSVSGFQKYCADNQWDEKKLVDALWTDNNGHQWSLLSRTGYLIATANHPNNPAFLKYIVDLYKKEKMLAIETEPGHPDALWSYWAMLNLNGASVANTVKDALASFHKGFGVYGDGGWIEKAIQMRQEMKRKDPEREKSFNDEYVTEHVFFWFLLGEGNASEEKTVWNFGKPSKNMVARPDSCPVYIRTKADEHWSALAVPSGLEDHVDAIFQQYLEVAKTTKNPNAISRFLNAYTVQLNEKSCQALIGAMQDSGFNKKSTEWSVFALAHIITNHQLNKVPHDLQNKLFVVAQSMIEKHDALQFKKNYFYEIMEQWVLSKELEGGLKKAQNKVGLVHLNRF